MRECVICKHPHRINIENALFKLTPENAETIVSKIALEYDVPEDDLRTHALFHTSFNCDPNGDSIVRQIKMREADMLGATALEYMNTMQLLGKRIRSCADDEDLRLEKMLTKPVTDLYIGCGDGVKNVVKALSDINQQLNGPKDDGSSGLAALAAALHASRNSGGEDV